MSHNPDPTLAPDAEPFFALPGHRVIALSGRDAVAFAQAQLMNDVEAVLPGHWQWSGWLTPKGRVIALFALLKRSDEALWLVLPDADAATIAAALARFVFRSKVKLVVRGDLHASGAFEAPREASGARFNGGTDAACAEFDLGAEGGPRTLRIAAG